MELPPLLQKRKSLDPDEEENKNHNKILTPTQVKQFFKKIPEFQEFLTKHKVNFKDYVQALVNFNATGQRFVRLKPNLTKEEKSKL